MYAQQTNSSSTTITKTPYVSSECGNLMVTHLTVSFIVALLNNNNDDLSWLFFLFAVVVRIK